MAVHYYDEDDLEVGSRVACHVVVNHTLVLTEEEKAEARSRRYSSVKPRSYAGCKSRSVQNPRQAPRVSSTRRS